MPQLLVATLKNKNKRLGKWMYPDPHFWDAYLGPPGAKLWESGMLLVECREAVCSSSKWFIVTFVHCFQSRVVWFPKKGSLPPDSGGGIHFGQVLSPCYSAELWSCVLSSCPSGQSPWSCRQCCNVHPQNIIKDRDCKLNSKTFSLLCLPGLCKMLSAWTIQAWQTSFTFRFVNQVEYFSPFFPTLNIYLGLN